MRDGKPLCQDASNDAHHGASVPLHGFGMGGRAAKVPDCGLSCHRRTQSKVGRAGRRVPPTSRPRPCMTALSQNPLDRWPQWRRKHRGRHWEKRGRIPHSLPQGTKGCPEPTTKVHLSVAVQQQSVPQPSSPPPPCWALQLWQAQMVPPGRQAQSSKLVGFTAVHLQTARLQRGGLALQRGAEAGRHRQRGQAMWRWPQGNAGP